MDGLDDLRGLIGFGDSASSLLEPSSPHPESSALAQDSHRPHNLGAPRTPLISLSQDSDAGSTLPPLDFDNDAFYNQPLGTSNATSSRLASPTSSGHRWFEPQPQRRSPSFNHASQGMFPVPSSTSHRSDLLDLPVPGSFSPRSSRAHGLPEEPIAGPSRWRAIDDPLTRDAPGSSMHASESVPSVDQGDQRFPQGFAMLDANPTETYFPSASGVLADPPTIAEPQRAASPQKRIVHGAFPYDGNETLWIEEVDIARVNTFLATPPSADGPPLASTGVVSSPSRFTNISPRSLLSTLDPRAFMRLFLRKLLSFAGWKTFLLRSLLRCLPRRGPPSSAQGQRGTCTTENVASPRPRDEDWEAYGAHRVYTFLASSGHALPPHTTGDSATGAAGQPERPPPPLCPPSWPSVAVVPIVHMRAAEYLLCPLLRHRPCGAAPLRWDVRSTDFSVPSDDSGFMSQPATWPLCSKLVVSCCANDPQTHWPWPITIYDPYGVTFRDVVTAIRENLKQAMWRHEWDELHPERRSAIERLKVVRAMAHPLGNPLPESDDDEVLRCDYLLGHTFFRGLTPSPQNDGWMMHFGAP
ncbi:hypothetical protein PENSPDRAFT_688014 [Peniophora sp. CONT]|nr:hypothetical protein PENSPDRAFT_688014 [Peniophora sp. CONT]